MIAVMADAHIRKSQYRKKARGVNFSEAFLRMCRLASEKADILCFAGDLFDGDVTPDLLHVAESGFSLFRKVFIIKGNHDFKYTEVRADWIDYIAANMAPKVTLIDHLNKHFEVINNVMFVGMNYAGSYTEESFAEVLEIARQKKASNPGVKILFMGHFLLSPLEVSRDLIVASRGIIDLGVVGDLHRPMVIDERFYSPGSLENCSKAEIEYEGRGCLILNNDLRIVDKIETVPAAVKIAEEVYDAENWYHLEVQNFQNIQRTPNVLTVSLKRKDQEAVEINPDDLDNLDIKGIAKEINPLAVSLLDKDFDYEEALRDEDYFEKLQNPQ